MKCPVCKDVTLLMSEKRGIEIDYCPECRGIWLDRGEIEKKKKKEEIYNREHYEHKHENKEYRNDKYDDKYSERNHYHDDYDDKYYKNGKYWKVMKSFFQLEKPMKSVFLLYAR